MVVSGICTSGQEEHHIEIRVFQPTMSSSRMVVGDVVSGKHGYLCIIIVVIIIIIIIIMNLLNLFSLNKSKEIKEKVQKYSVS